MAKFSRLAALSAGLICISLIIGAIMVTAQDDPISRKSDSYALYKVIVGSKAEAEALRNTSVDPVMKITKGYLVLADEESYRTLLETDLQFEQITDGLNRSQLALDISLNGKNVDLYPIVYNDNGIHLLRIPSDLEIAKDGHDQLMRIGDHKIRIVYREPKQFDLSKRADGMDLETLIALVSEDSLSSYVYALQAFPPRVTGSIADYSSRDWIYNKFVEFGYDSVAFDSFTYSGDNVQNIVAYKVGTTYPDHHIVVGGHKDAVSGSPGADDNGSGTAGVLEIARVLKDIDTEMTFVFVCFTGEEQGLHGSWHYADEAAAAGDSIVMMLNMDMIGYQGNTDDVKVYHGSDLTWPNLWVDLADSLSTNMNGVLSGTIQYSDHWPFQSNGYDVVFLIEYNFSSVYHTYQDSTSYMDFTYMTRIVQSSLATAYQTQLLYLPTPGIAFAYPSGHPESVYPGSTTTFQVEIEGSSGGTIVPGSATMYYRPVGETTDSVALTNLGGSLYEATLPTFICDDNTIEYWFGADEVSTGRHYDGGPSSPYTTPVATAVMTAFSDDFEGSNVWTFSGGLWNIGTPTGGGGAYGGPDPSSAYQGSNVLGYNLSGDYTNSMPEYNATTPIIDCSGMSNTTLRFWRWLGVEQPLYDHAYVRVSNDGTTWTTIWENSEEVYDGEWVLCEYDISSIADGNQIYVRFTMGTSDGGWTYCGWNIDELSVFGYQCDQQQMVITTDEVPDWTMGMGYSTQLEVSGGFGTHTWSDKYNDLDGTGLSLSTDGLLAGMPAAASDITFTAEVTDDNQNSVEKQYTFTINPELEIITASINDATEGKYYSFTIQASGGTGSKIWVDLNNDLDGTGLVLGSSGMIGGSPTVHGDYQFTAQVTDSVGAIDEQTYTLTILADYICGDLNDDQEINILDILFLIDYKYQEGPAPDPLEAADVNSDGNIDILDILFLIEYKYQEGPEPNCQ